MPEESPNFSSTPITEGATKKRRTYHRRRVASRAQSISAEKIDKMEPLEKVDKKDLDRNLTSIYSDHGKMPDMKKIRVRKSNPFMRGLLTLIIFGGILAAAAWSGFFVLPNQNKFSDAQLDLKISGPETVALGTEETYNISYENKQNIALNNAVLSIKYPETFSFTNSSIEADNAGHTEWKIGAIAAKQKGNITITGKSYGATDQTGSWRVFLTYQPENFNSELQKLTTLNTKIGQSPFTLAISGPDKATAGNEVEYTFSLSNTGTWWPEKMELTPTWPSNFNPTSSTPAFAKGNKWLITNANLQTSATGQIAPLTFRAIGKWSDTGEVLASSTSIKANLNLTYNDKTFSIAESSLNTEVAKNNIGLNLVVNGASKDVSTQPGEALNITIGLKNTSPADLSKAAIKFTISAPSYKKQSVLAWSDITDKYDGNIEGKQISDIERQGSITWNSTLIKELAKIKPNQEINIDVRLPLKDIKSFDWEQVNNFKMNLSAEVSYTDTNGNKQTISSNPIAASINSDLKFESRDNISTNSTGRPEHEISWILTNNYHALKNIQLTAEIFGDSTYTAPENVPAGKFNFDQAAKKITWTIDEMPTSVDTLATTFNVVINKENPTQNTLVSKIRIQAVDAVTGANLDLMADEVSLNQPIQ